MCGLKFIPTYRVISKEEINKKKDRITLFSVNSRIRRTWYTLWLGKKEEYHVLGNVNEEGDVLLSVTSASLSDKAIEELQREWKKVK